MRKNGLFYITETKPEAAEREKKMDKIKVIVAEAINANQTVYWLTYTDGKNIWNSPAWLTRKAAIRWAEKHDYEVVR